ncbi:methyltransferase domain-containing protein [Mycena sanguinolenta]|nr:methyltransferase domain-containing protein [Mycena sanguinolenta]
MLQGAHDFRIRLHRITDESFSIMKLSRDSEHEFPLRVAEGYDERATGAFLSSILPLSCGVRRKADAEGGFPAPNTASYTLWDLYIPAFSCPFPVFRVGVMGDGGKWICGLERATHHRDCIIYSMGVEHQSSFEQAMLHQSEDCQVYGFDFSVSEWGPELRADTAVNACAHFFPYKIGATDNHTADPKEYSLCVLFPRYTATIPLHTNRTALTHARTQIDIKDSEFRALKAVIESFKGGPLPFGQMQIEIHVDFDPDHVKTIGEFDAWWSMLEDAGLCPFWTELNVLDANIYLRGPRRFGSSPDSASRLRQKGLVTRWVI